MPDYCPPKTLQELFDLDADGCISVTAEKPFCILGTTDGLAFVIRDGTGGNNITFSVTTKGLVTIAQPLTIPYGGTGAATATAAFNNLSPTTTTGDIIYQGLTGDDVRLGIGLDGQVLTVVSGEPRWLTGVTLPANLVISASTPTTDNALCRFNGSVGTSIQDTSIIIDDNDNIVSPGAARFGNIAIDETANQITMTAAATDLKIITATAANKVHLEDTNLTVENSAFAALGYSTLVTDNTQGRVGVGAQTPADLMHLLVPNLGAAVAATMRIEAGNGNAGLSIISAAPAASFQTASFETEAGTSTNQSKWFFGHTNVSDFIGGGLIIATNTAGLVPRATISVAGRMAIDKGYVAEPTYTLGLGTTNGTAGNLGAEGGAVINNAQGTATTSDFTVKTGASANAFFIDASGDSIQNNAANFGAFGATPVAKPTVTGSRGGNAALASLLTGLANLGWVTDNST